MNRSSRSLKKDLSCTRAAVFKAHSRSSQIEQPSAVSSIADESAAATSIFSQVIHPCFAGQRIIACEIAQAHNLEAGPFSFPNNLAQVNEFAARKHAILNEKSFRVIANTFRADYPPIQEQTTGLQQAESFPEISREPPTPHMLEHSNGCDFVIASVEVPVIAELNGDTLVKPPLLYGILRKR